LVQPGADRALRSKTGPRFATRLQRVLLAIIATGFIIGGGSGLVEDLTMRAHGTATTAVMVGYSGRRAIVRYHAQGSDYTMASHFNGDWTLGETETVLYRPDNPAQAIEGANLKFVTLFMGIGVLLLGFALFGGRLIPGWS
jgi:hypothetical protein